MDKKYIPAILLITAGVLLLLYQMDLFYLSTPDLISYGFVVLGIVFLINSFSNPHKKGVLGGVFFILFGGVMVLMRENMLPRADEFGVGAFFAALALANLAAMLTKREKLGNLAWVIVFGIISGMFFWAYYGYYSTWYVIHQLEIFWPAALIIIGVLMVAKAYARKRRSLAVNG
ncbi:MAG: hypothetical protein E4H13_11225 [Calditrichales bacterium]|nr:MAG: hypothetical protein E4H13_11225 [Calditrichales bacterium]